MAYNAKNGQEAKGTGATLPKDDILTGVITKIDDGIVKQFIPETAVEGWKGDVNSKAINLEIEVAVETGGKTELVKITQMFTYIDEDGKTLYTSKSNLGKYFKKYGKLPEPGDQIKVLTNSEGFGRIKLD